MNAETRRKLFWMTVFSVAIGWLEAAVVVYLRYLYYPDGFNFPVKVIPWEVGWVELVREVATILMLVGIGVLAGKTKHSRFAWFIFAFGLWDIVYYLGLKVALGWPESLLTMDLLFLIPVPWIGPVIAPVLVSLAMIGAALVIVVREEAGKPLELPLWTWIAETVCGLVIILSFTIDWRSAFGLNGPAAFKWWIFLAGFVPGIGIFVWRWLGQVKSTREMT